MYAPTTLPRKEVEVGAIADPQYLSGRAAAIDIFPGQQFTATDFAADPNATVKSQITGVQRALSISIDAVHGSLSQVAAGDSVDIYIGVRRCREALPAEREGSGRSDPGGREPRAAHRPRRTRPTSRSRPTTHSSGSSFARSSAQSRPLRDTATAATVLR